MTLAFRSLTLLSSLSMAGCVSSQQLGDPQATDGGSGGAATESTAAAETESMAGSSSTEADPTEAGTDTSVHDDCVELVWDCPTDALVCIPAEGLCVPCAGLGESPASAEGGHCCDGLVQTSDGTECVADPEPDGCLAAGDICGYGGVAQACCDGTVCNPDTDLCESDGQTAEVCADFTPPPIECPEVGAGSAALVDIGRDGLFEGVAFEQADRCLVGDVLPGPEPSEVIAIDCGAFTSTFSFVSEPGLFSGLEAGDPVAYAAIDTQHPNPEPSISIHAPDGTLRFAFVDDRDLSNGVQTELGDFEVTIAGTGCTGFDAGAVACEVDGESIVGARVEVGLTAGDQSLQLSQGHSGEITVGDVTYDVVVDRAERIVCWDDSCAGDESGPSDRLRMLIVAR